MLSGINSSQNLINGVVFSNAYQFMAFTNSYIESKIQQMDEFLSQFTTVPKAAETSRIELMANDFATFIMTLFENNDKLEPGIVPLFVLLTRSSFDSKRRFRPKISTEFTDKENGILSSTKEQQTKWSYQSPCI